MPLPRRWLRVKRIFAKVDITDKSQLTAWLPFATGALTWEKRFP